MIHQHFSPEVEEKAMTIAQALRQEGRQEGKLEENMLIAKRLISENVDIF